MTAITQFITNFLQTFHHIVEGITFGDPFMKPIVSLAMLTITGFLARTVLKRYPRMIWAWVKNKFVFSLEIIDDDSYSAKNYFRFMKFYEQHRPKRGSRRFRLLIQLTRTVKAAAPGFHWFYFEGKYYWFTMKNLDSGGSEKVKSAVTISSYGLTDAVLDRLINAFCVKPPSTLGIYYTNPRSSRDVWHRKAEIRDLSLNDLIMDDEEKATLIERLDWFVNNEAWYRARHRDYKLVIMLKGPPGTGKSFLARAIACHLRRNMYVVGLEDDHSFGMQMDEVPAGKSVVLMEDFDDVSSLHKRKTEEGDVNELVHRHGGVRLSTMLNKLQGVNTSNGHVIIMTTNHIELLDPALYRGSRVNLMLEVGPFKSKQIKQYLAKMYSPEAAARYDFEWAPVNVSKLDQWFEESPHDIDAFVKNLEVEDVDYGNLLTAGNFVDIPKHWESSLEVK